MFGRNKSATTPQATDPRRNGHQIVIRDVVKTFKTAAGDFTALKNIGSVPVTGASPI